MSVHVLLKKPLAVPGVVSVCLRNKFTSEHFKRGRPLNRDKYWGRIVEDGEFYVCVIIEHGIFGEGSQISTNHKRENDAFSLLIG